jgi:predicted esterase
VRALLPAVLALAASLAAAPARCAAEDPPFPAGTSSQTLDGLRCSVVMPDAFDPAKERSMIVILHGAGGSETGMAGSLQLMAADDFVVVAPKSTADTWDKKDIDAVRRIAASLRKRLRIGEGRLHAAGFSNGGWNLAPLAFDEDLRCASACWIASGYSGGMVPKAARKGMGALALAGSEDPNRGAAEKTPDLLKDKVRCAECLIQPGIAHKWPDKLVPYLRWWLLVMEGRFTPGDCGAFDWAADPAAAEAAMKSRKAGGFAYFFSKDQAGDAAAKAFQNEALRDPLVQRFGRQLVAWKLERAEAAEAFAKEGLKETPAVVVYDADGKAVKSLQGQKISPAALGIALRSVAADRSMPKR